MNLHIPEIRVGEPTICGGVAVFPLFAEPSLFPDGSGSCDYALAGEAMAAGTVAVSEVSEAGQVPYLLLDNCGDCLSSSSKARKSVGVGRTVSRAARSWQRPGAGLASPSSAPSGNGGTTAAGSSLSAPVVLRR